MFTYRRMKASEKNYALQLSRDEINIEPKKLDESKTYIIYNGKERIGFISFRFRPDHTIYIYILAFEKKAQGRGFAQEVIESMMVYGRKKDERFRGLSATIHKVNEPAIHAAVKYGFQVTGERAKYFDFVKPASD